MPRSYSAPLRFYPLPPAGLPFFIGLQGWQFGGDGGCRAIPQLAGLPPAASACSSKRACATAYPTRRYAGLLWVWPDASEAGCAAADAAEPCMPPDVAAVFSGEEVAVEVRAHPSLAELYSFLLRLVRSRACPCRCAVLACGEAGLGWDAVRDCSVRKAPAQCTHPPTAGHGPPEAGHVCRTLHIVTSEPCLFRCTLAR